jgi:hypothetical protein
MVVAKVKERWAKMNKQHRILKWRFTISGNCVSWSLGKRTRLKSQVGLQL